MFKLIFLFVKHSADTTNLKKKMFLFNYFNKSIVFFFYLFRMINIYQKNCYKDDVKIMFVFIPDPCAT